MASTKLRDIRNDHLKPIVMASAEPPPPPVIAPELPPEPISPSVAATSQIVTPPSPSSPPTHNGSPNWVAVGVFAAVFCIGGIGIYSYNKQKNEQEYYTSDEPSYESSIHSESSVSAMDAAQAAEAAAADAAAAEDAAVTADVATSSDNNVVNEPLLTYGSNWTYKVVDYAKPENSYDNVRLSVSEVKPDGYTFYKEWIGTKRDPAVLDYDDHLNLRGGAIATYSPALSYYDFPLYEGKTWHSESEVIGHKYNTSDYMTFDGKVVGWESVSSPEWSDINALRVEVEIITFKDNVEIARDLDVSWYEPDVGRAIKTLDYKWNTETQSYGNPTRMHYVVNYNRR